MAYDQFLRQTVDCQRLIGKTMAAGDDEEEKGACVLCLIARRLIGKTGWGAWVLCWIGEGVVWSS